MRLLLPLALAMQLGCAASTAVQQAEKVRRTPLAKSGLTLKAPTEYEHRARVDPKTNEPVAYDPKPQVVLVDEKSGKYAFKWVGYDGKEKIVEYQRADAVDVVVSASVSKTPSGQYLYTYNVKNLPSNGPYLSGFAVQNFAPDTQPVKTGEGYVGQMSSSINQFSEGHWFRFGESYLGKEIIPGRSVDVQLRSSAPPGLVGCRAHGGNLTLKGAGEHMPTELENAMSGYEEWPKGYTIGPVGMLTTLSKTDHAKYVLSLLPQLFKLGWMTSSAQQWYEKKLKSSDLEVVRKHAEHDLQSEQITSEVFAMIQAIRE